MEKLDALIGKHITQERPEVHWEDSGRNFRFDSVEEALDAFHDPHLREHVRESVVEGAFMLQEVEEFRCYSSDISVAWDAVACFDRPLHVRRAEGKWFAAFDGSEPVAAISAPVAICCAALRARGIEVEIDGDGDAAGNVGNAVSDSNSHGTAGQRLIRPGGYAKS